MSYAEPQPVFLVTGATGFVGSHLIERLSALGMHVRCLVRKTSSRRYLPAQGVELVEGDLVTGQGLEAAVDGVDIVLHVAGVTKARSEREYWEGNVRGTENLVKACERATGLRRLVHVSSLAAAGPSPDGTPLTEDAVPRPLTWYGRSKLAGETLVRNSALAAKTVVLRPPVVYGPRDTDVFEVFRAVSKGLMLLIGSGESYFSYIHVTDLVEALLAAASREGAEGKTYFVGNPEPVSWTAFASAAAGVMHRPVRCLRIPAAVAYTAGWAAEIASSMRAKPSILSRQKVLEARCRWWTSDSSRARNELGLCSYIPLEQGIASTLAWYKDAGWLTF